MIMFIYSKNILAAMKSNMSLLTLNADDDNDDGENDGNGDNHFVYITGTLTTCKYEVNMLNTRGLRS